MVNGDVEAEYDRLKEVKEFDDSKIGVKGLLNSGVTTIPRFFHHPPESRPAPRPPTRTHSSHLFPVVDLSGPHSIAVEHVRRAASEGGFFQITNHGVPIKRNKISHKCCAPSHYYAPSHGSAPFALALSLLRWITSSFPSLDGVPAPALSNIGFSKRSNRSI